MAALDDRMQAKMQTALDQLGWLLITLHRVREAGLDRGYYLSVALPDGALPVPVAMLWGLPVNWGCGPGILLQPVPEGH